jgi:hypothetical protein
MRRTLLNLQAGSLSSNASPFRSNAGPLRGDAGSLYGVVPCRDSKFASATSPANGFHLRETVSPIYLNLGFRQPFRYFVRLNRLGCLERSEAQGHSYPLLHQHIEHPQPPALEQSIKEDKQDPVFPAVLVISNEAQIQKEIDGYLCGLLNCPEC